MEEPSDRPYIIAALVATLDGKASGTWLFNKNYMKTLMQFFEMHKDLKVQGTCLGKNSCRAEVIPKDAKMDLSPYKGKTISLQEDFIACKDNQKGYFFALDSKGTLPWQENTLNIKFDSYNGLHIVELLTEQAPMEYLAYLQEKKISYLIGGKEKIDLKSVMKKAKEIFGVKRFSVEGGVSSYGSFMKEGLVDEIRVMTIPCVGNENDISMFPGASFKEYQITNVTFDSESNFIHTIYKVKK